MNKGRVLQTGRTVDVFRRPATVDVGFVFSDPPMKSRDVSRAARRSWARTSGCRWPATSPASPKATTASAFGRTTCSFRRPHRRGRGDPPTRVEQAEVSGSETFIHAEHGGMRVVVQEEGVHGFELNEALTVYAGPRDGLFAFGRRWPSDRRPPGGEV